MRAANVIESGGVIAFRTDTFYGLGADPFNPDALRRINELKGRDGKPILVVISDASEADFFINEKSATFERVCRRHWPGALTIVMGAKPEVPEELTAGTKTVGLRLPDDEVVRAFIRACGGKLTATSANLTGEPPAKTAEDVASSFPEGLDLIVDGGPATSDKPSSILDLSGSLPNLIREGVISRRNLEKTLDLQKFRSEIFLGCIVNIFGLLVVPILLIVFFYVMGQLQLLSSPVSIVIFILAILLGRKPIREMSANVRRLGRLYSAMTDAQTVVAKDLRQPVLYLRSFREEKENIDRKDKKTAEELLSSVLKDVGPFVAIGNPNDRDKLLGAARFHLDEGDNWQDIVRKLMSNARLVVINPELLSDGLKWEIETALDKLNHEKIIFSFLSYQFLPKDSTQALFRPGGHLKVDARLEIKSLLKQNLKRPIPDYYGKEVFLYFDKSGDAQFVKLKAWAKKVFGKTSVLVVRETLRPILKQRGIKLSIWPTLRRIILILLILSIVGQIVVHSFM